MKLSQIIQLEMWQERFGMALTAYGKHHIRVYVFFEKQNYHLDENSAKHNSGQNSSFVVERSSFTLMWHYFSIVFPIQAILVETSCLSIIAQVTLPGLLEI